MFSSRSRSLGAVMIAFICFGTLSARSNVDIGLYQNGNNLEIKLRPEMDFDGVLSSIVFTIKWDKNSGAVLGDLHQDNAAGTYIPLQRSGTIRQDSQKNYQIFAGFGMTAVGQTGTTWRAGQEYTIAVIPYSGNAQFELTRDQWTKQLASNADYFISLGGEDQTGIVYKELAGNAADSPSLSIVPNPNRGQFQLTIPVNDEENMWFELINSAGQVVQREVPNAGENSFRKDMDLTDAGAGVYLLRIHRNSGMETHRIVVN